MRSRENLYIKPLYSDGFSIHIERVSMVLLIVYLEGSRVEFSELWCIAENSADSAKI